ncbi:MAG: PAS domain-containing protein, partial [Alphaproteobacteria bacterium]|nr:PAS domain-containing protein [Alphaproteobacteria bacterium]
MDEPRLRAVLDTAVDGVILIDADGIVRMFNPACERLFGYARDEVIG